MQHRRWPSRVWTVRHGESSANIALRDAIASGLDQVRVIGRDADVPLSAVGEEQARAAGRWFRTLSLTSRPERVLCSPFRRTRRTAELIVAEANLDVHIQSDERLREKDLGSLEKLTRQGLQHRDPMQSDLHRELGKFYYRPPGGESWCDVIGRLRNLLYQFVLHEDDRPVLFVCHQAVITCMRLIFEHLDEERVLQIDREDAASNCAISEYAVADDGGRPRMRLVHWNLDPTSDVGKA
ncbi:histidine phosphatase family protein [Methylobacterium sp. J-077]|uniref:histidine phosphatase family protein n=1 Tax=Methylobacterium sp. J-077 TaxID=2836656 RepID=UPI001FB86B06|nr:histidine phosphatase family protein [Methylobacterium sp. J-077]MCJ2124948.1 histidine phosphatase family protein [Methylobacterium sp. J-077]